MADLVEKGSYSGRNDRALERQYVPAGRLNLDVSSPFFPAMQHEKCVHHSLFQQRIRRSRMAEWIHVISKLA